VCAAVLTTYTVSEMQCFISCTEQHGPQGCTKLSQCQWWDTHDRRQWVRQGGTRNSQTSSSIWRGTEM